MRTFSVAVLTDFHKEVVVLVPLTIGNMLTLFVDGLFFFSGGVLAYGVMRWIGSLIVSSRAPSP